MSLRLPAGICLIVLCALSACLSPDDSLSPDESAELGVEETGDIGPAGLVETQDRNCDWEGRSGCIQSCSGCGDYETCHWCVDCCECNYCADIDIFCEVCYGQN